MDRNEYIDCCLTIINDRGNVSKTSRSVLSGLQRSLYYREHLKYVWNVYCVVTNHMGDFTPQKPQATNRFPAATEQISFVVFKDTICLNRILKRRCFPRSVLRIASRSSFEFKKKKFRSQRDATATSFPCNDINEDNKNEQ